MLGDNILAQYVDQAKVEQHIALSKPAVMIVMGQNSPDAHNWALNLKQTYPASTVIYREYNPHDQNWDGFTAEQIWSIHSPFAVGGLAVQVWNEPNGYQPLAPLVGKAKLVAQYARQENKQAGLPSWGVGHPDDARVAAGELDPLLIELAADHRANANLYLVHEYAQDSTAAEQPYRIGRFVSTLARGKSIGASISYNRVIVAEYGRDANGNPTLDGWQKHFNGNEQAYSDFLVPGAALYVRLGVRGACVFCCGSTWPSFDYQNALTVQHNMESFNVTNPVTPPTPTPPASPLIAGSVLELNSNYANVRPTPDTVSPALKQIHVGDPIIYHADPVQGGQYKVGSVTRTDWYALDVGYLAAGVAVLGSTLPDVALYSVPTPFVSQDTATASKRDDCGPACALMTLRWRNAAAGMLDPVLWTVNDLSAHTSLASLDDGLTLDEVSHLLTGVGVKNAITRPLDLVAITAQLKAGKPVIALVNDKYFGGMGVGHFVVVVAVGQTTFWVHDPDIMGANYNIKNVDFDKALSDVLAFNAYAYQGITFP